MEEKINTEETKEKVEDEKLNKVNGGWATLFGAAGPFASDSNNQNSETSKAVFPAIVGKKM